MPTKFLNLQPVGPAEYHGATRPSLGNWTIRQRGGIHCPHLCAHDQEPQQERKLSELGGEGYQVPHPSAPPQGTGVTVS